MIERMEVGEAESGLGLKASLRSCPLKSIQTPVPSQVQGHDGVLVSPSTESGSMTTAAQSNQVPAPNSSHASRSHSQTDGIVKDGWKVSYWITALTFAAFISILCMYLGDNTSDKIHKPLFKACILSVGASFAIGLGLIALLQMAAHSSFHIQSLIILVKILEYCGIGSVALAFGTGSYALFGKMYIEFVFIIPIVVLVIGLALMFCHRNDGNQSEDPV
ncbi:hypothetical protein QJS10_CPA01g00672 [Acorus calamus]|uniref:Uncharacterized protein n=1 Tax=Acorus calamus TaxID=4465 RepID=A0AAV9FGB8_ACOCL|nr:hypothetical protein QJS10_CPA01g00672 [Acorus calamus]